MDNMEFLVVIYWCLASATFGALGYAIGNTEPGSGPLGALLGLLLGPIGWVIVILLNMSKKSSRERFESLQFQRYEVLRAERAADALREATRPPVTNVRIRREEKVIGSWDVHQIREFLQNGTLCWEDEYFDPAQKGWVQLAGHPDV